MEEDIEKRVLQNSLTWKARDLLEYTKAAAALIPFDGGYIAVGSKDEIRGLLETLDER